MDIELIGEKLIVIDKAHKIEKKIMPIYEKRMCLFDTPSFSITYNLSFFKSLYSFRT